MTPYILNGCAKRSTTTFMIYTYHNNKLIKKTYPSQNQKLVYQALVQSILLYGAETWTLNTQQANKLLATEMDFWRRSARKSKKEKVRNVTIREVMEVGKKIKF
jgi:chromosome condensin MukBEF complex kleisin-like MukF subunit